jgi:uncharacterized protein (DUF924 family)
MQSVILCIAPLGSWGRSRAGTNRGEEFGSHTRLNAQATAVLDFWFADSHTPRAEWFKKDAAFDALIAERFGTLIGHALSGALAAWGDEPDSALAQVIVLDQFTRNTFRDTPRAFAGDALALPAARAMVARGDDLALPPLRRLFAYMPFEHAEDRATQQESLRLFAALRATDASLADFEDYARRHAAVIDRFGRFPHRNAILGRASTTDELAFLQQPGSSF